MRTIALIDCLMCWPGLANAGALRNRRVVAKVIGYQNSIGKQGETT